MNSDVVGKPRGQLGHGLLGLSWKIASLGIQEDVPLLLYSKSDFSYYYLLRSIFCYVKQML
jgi:hypothetical protein